MFYKELERFIQQADSNAVGNTNLTTRQYIQNYKNLNVSVSFGKGNPAKIPWIAFLNNMNTVQNGIYPVYLYFVQIKTLILAYGISETNTPNDNWDIVNPKSLNEYFLENGLGNPKRYGSSYIYKAYNFRSVTIDSSFDSDLDSIINLYNTQYSNNIHNQMIETDNSVNKSMNYVDSFSKYLKKSGLFFDDLLIKRFNASLLCKQFVILTGLSGSGKTKLAQAFAQWICSDVNQYCIIPVGADWTNRDPLLGYPNALEPNKYVRPDNKALDVILNAINTPDVPHFLILDEMNLSHVERYFSDFLSAMESKEDIPLHSNDIKNLPKSIKLPDNLFFIGTVNIDETTYMFSPKVLDRANTIEFRVLKNEIHEFLDSTTELDLSLLQGKGASMGESFLCMSREKFNRPLEDNIKNKLLSFFEELKKVGAEFGYRSASEIIRLINQLSVIAPELTDDHKLDIALIQKLLPKLHGSRRKLCPVLIALGNVCIDKEIFKDIENSIFTDENFDYSKKGIFFPLSLEKISRMYKNALENGFASYAEA